MNDEQFQELKILLEEHNHILADVAQALENLTVEFKDFSASINDAIRSN